MPQACRSPAGGGSPGRAGAAGRVAGGGGGAGNPRLAERPRARGVCACVRVCVCVTAVAAPPLCGSRAGGSCSCRWRGRSRGRAAGGSPVGPRWRRRAACARCGHMSRGEGRGPRSRGGRALAAPRRCIVQGAQGLGVTSLPAGGAGRGGAGGGRSVQCGRGERGPAGEGSAAAPGSAPPPPAPWSRYTWASGLGRAVFLWVSRIIEETGKIRNVFRLRH